MRERVRGVGGLCGWEGLDEVVLVLSKVVYTIFVLLPIPMLIN